MTHDPIDTVRDDIAYVRNLAQEGRNAPLLNGPIMVAAAVIFGLASVGQYAIQAGLIDTTPWAQLWLWIAAGVVFSIALFILIGRIKANPRSETQGAKAVGAAWSGVGFGIFSIWVGLMAIGFTTGLWQVMSAMPIVVFAAYGSAWMVAGVMTGSRWMTFTAVACYVGAALLGVFVSSPIGYLVFAALLVFCALLPGLALTRQASTGKA